MSSEKIVICGGGIIGVSIAYRLALRGVSSCFQLFPCLIILEISNFLILNSIFPFNTIPIVRWWLCFWFEMMFNDWSWKIVTKISFSLFFIFVKIVFLLNNIVLSWYWVVIHQLFFNFNFKKKFQSLFYYFLFYFCN